jgi:serine/threonine-protein kinase
MIEFTTFGATELRRDGTDVRSVLSQPKRLALLAYLAIGAPGGFVARDRLLALFWPESDDERARNALRQSLHFLRRSLGEDALVGRGDRDIGVNAALVSCDAVAFQGAIEQERHETACGLYRGEFLPGFHVEEAPDVERWIEDTRAAFARRASAAAWSLCDRDDARGETAAAVLWARRAIAIEPLGEAGVRRLMSILASAGERAASRSPAASFGGTRPLTPLDVMANTGAA